MCYSIFMKKFKEFCLFIWKNKNVENTCLNLQDNYRATVAVILYAKWCDTYALHFDPRIIDFSKKYELDHIIPLRTIRKSLEKNAISYKQAMHDELHAEFALIKILTDSFPIIRKDNNEGSAIEYLSKYYHTDIPL